MSTILSHSLSHLGALALIAAAICGCNPPGPPLVDAQPEPGTDYLAVKFEQDGNTVPIVNHRVSLRRAPFKVVVALRELGGVFVNASPDSRMIEAAADGADLRSIAPLEPYPDTQPGSLLIGSGVFDYWYAVSPRTHNFDEVHEVTGPGGNMLFALCSRTINGLGSPHQARPHPIGDTPDRPLYIVFVNTESVPGRGRVERQRIYSRIDFTD